MNNLTVNEKEKIFAVKTLNVVTFDDPSANGWELRYEVEDGTKGTSADYFRQRVWRDAEGKYFLDVKANARCNLNNFGDGFFANYLTGTCIENGFRAEVRIPVTPEALAVWAYHSPILFGEKGEDITRAMEEFKGSDNCGEEMIWVYQQGAKANQQGFIYEFLRKTDNMYMLYSTDGSYPYPCESGPLRPFAETYKVDLGGCQDQEVYRYDITPETARRWAEVRGMGQITCQMVFGG